MQNILVTLLADYIDKKLARPAKSPRREKTKKACSAKSSTAPGASTHEHHKTTYVLRTSPAPRESLHQKQSSTSYRTNSTRSSTSSSDSDSSGGSTPSAGRRSRIAEVIEPRRPGRRATESDRASPDQLLRNHHGRSSFVLEPREGRPQFSSSSSSHRTPSHSADGRSSQSHYPIYLS